LKAAILVIISVFAFSSQAVAGWYRIENFEGLVGQRPVHFSIQRYDGFGSGITVKGSYFYDDERKPIALYGKANGETLELCEIANDQEFREKMIVGSKTPIDTAGCPFAIKVDATAMTGVRNDGKAAEAVTLKKVAALDDTSGGVITGAIQIPFWAHNANHSFSGNYEKTAFGICMTTLRVIDRITGRVNQEIRFKNEACDAGMVMTSIYQNVETFVEDGADIVVVNFKDGGMGYSRSFKFDAITRTFKQTD